MSLDVLAGITLDMARELAEAQHVCGRPVLRPGGPADRPRGAGGHPVRLHQGNRVSILCGESEEVADAAVRGGRHRSDEPEDDQRAAIGHGHEHDHDGEQVGGPDDADDHPDDGEQVRRVR